MNEDITSLSIRDLLGGDAEYLIPMYQRNYAWDEGEITQLIQDVLDDLPAGRHYYIGTLVVFERRDGARIIYETIDGQQRLTTLSLLASYLKKEGIKKDGGENLEWYRRQSVSFESREHSRKTFDAIFAGNFDKDPVDVLREGEVNGAILNGYRLIKKILQQKLRESGISDATFAEYLFSKVRIMRVRVPHDTDLNHYFEIMNNRGEQLEKHEVLKSRMMEVLNQGLMGDELRESQSCLHTVWEACANMEWYVQMGFTPEQRDAVFGPRDWGQLPRDFDALRAALRSSSAFGSPGGPAQTLDQIIAQAQSGAAAGARADDAPERFNTVINFPNFLLQVLRVYTREDVPLDDKRLLTTFESLLFKPSDAFRRVQGFIYALLRSRYLFDQFVIKREFLKGTDGWSLKRFKWNEAQKGRTGRPGYVNTFGDDDDNRGQNRTILMLLSAFHVSTPTLVYKHWLNAVLYYVFYADRVEVDTYLRHLESVARAFVFDRFLRAEGGLDYFEMIYTKKGVCQTTRQAVSEDDLRARSSFGETENNLVFNYLDYLLWLKYGADDPKVRAYEFTFRSSVEHYYPQTPMPGHDPLPKDVLDSFGNLCLISHSKNSRLSNFMPEAKKEYYKNNTLDSVKQYLMMQSGHWDANHIAEHYEAMMEVLLSSLDREVVPAPTPRRNT